jgi:prepilin-type N-terminal cleavage/methylation domain-containing protein
MLEKKSKHKVWPDQRGFTLVELLMVIGIMAMLSAIAVQQIKFNRENAYDRQAQTTVRNLLTYASVDTPQGVETFGNGGNMEPFGYPEVELPENVYWNVVFDADRWRFYFGHPGGIIGYYFWVPGDAYSGSLDDDGDGLARRSDKIYADAVFRAAVPGI